MNNYRNDADNILTPGATTENDHHHDRGTTGGTSSTGARACARTREAEATANMLRGQYVDCCQYYTEAFRRAVPVVVQRDIAEHIRDGMTADVIRAAMDETQAAPRPSWAYCRAILRRCDLEGIKTMQQWQESKRQREQRRNPALDYQQREYTEDMFGPEFFLNVGGR